MKIVFFPSRTAARNAAKLAGVKPIDNGADSAPGKRWAIQVENVAPETIAPGKPSAPAMLPPAEDAAPISDPVVAVSAEVVTLAAPRHPSGRRYPFQSRSTMVQGSNGRKIPVEWRKRHALEIHA